MTTSVMVAVPASASWQVQVDVDRGNTGEPTMVRPGESRHFTFYGDQVVSMKEVPLPAREHDDERKRTSPHETR